MIRVKVTRVSEKDVPAEGDKKGYKKIGIQTNVHGDKWLGCFYNKFNEKGLDSIKEGMSVDIMVEKNGDFLNFRLPQKIDFLEARVERLESHIHGDTLAREESPEVDPTEDIPF